MDEGKLSGKGDIDAMKEIFTLIIQSYPNI
jgi:hypothetical protein